MLLSARWRTPSPPLKTGMGCTGGLGHCLEEAEDLCAWTLHENPPACPSKGSGRGTPLQLTRRNLRTPRVGGRFVSRGGERPPNEALAAPSGDSAHCGLDNSGVRLENVSPYTVSTDNCVSWNSEWSRQRGLLRQPGPECHPMLTLRLPLPKNSPSVLHDATQPVVRTFAVPCKLSLVNVREGERRSPFCGHPLHF